MNPKVADMAAEQFGYQQLKLVKFTSTEKWEISKTINPPGLIAGRVYCFLFFELPSLQPICPHKENMKGGEQYYLSREHVLPIEYQNLW